MNREEFIKSLNLKGLGIEIGVQSGNYSSKILEYSKLHLILLDSWRELNNYQDRANVNTEHHIMLMNNTLKNLKEFNKLYEYSEDIYDSQGNIVEIMTKSGLRIPVKPLKKDNGKQNSEVYSTINEIQETDLTFGDPSKEDLETYKKISYNWVKVIN